MLLAGLAKLYQSLHAAQADGGALDLFLHLIGMALLAGYRLALLIDRLIQLPAKAVQDELFLPAGELASTRGPLALLLLPVLPQHGIGVHRLPQLALRLAETALGLTMIALGLLDQQLEGLALIQFTP